VRLDRAGGDHAPDCKYGEDGWKEEAQSVLGPHQGTL
jgi:hypothetical protein